MAVILHKRAFEHAKRLVEGGKFVLDDRDQWSEHQRGVLSAESRAGQYKYMDIENAAAHLHGMLDAVKASRK